MNGETIVTEINAVNHKIRTINPIGLSSKKTSVILELSHNRYVFQLLPGLILM